MCVQAQAVIRIGRRVSMEQYVAYPNERVVYEGSGQCKGAGLLCTNVYRTSQRPS